jgi:hypothetical protein
MLAAGLASLKVQRRKMDCVIQPTGYDGAALKPAGFPRQGDESRLGGFFR